MTWPIVDVALAAVIDRRAAPPRLLITRRPEGTPYAGYWELPGGKAEHGEAIEACLVRELKEELGVSVELGAALPVVEHSYAHAHVRLHPFICRMREGEPRNLGVAEHRWVKADELESYRFPEANEPILRAILSEMDRPRGA